LPCLLLFIFVFYICLSLKKLVNKKYFLVKEKFDLIFRKVFSFYFWQKILSRSGEKIRNIILFVDYMKFGLQTFDCYIFYFESFYFILSLKFWFLYQLCSLFFWVLFILFEIIYEIVIYYFLISLFFNFFIY